MCHNSHGHHQGRPPLPRTYLPLILTYSRDDHQGRKPPVGLDVMSLVASSCGHDSGHIEPRVAYALAGHWATHGEPTERTQHRHPPPAPPVAPVHSIKAGVHGCPRGVAPITPHPAMRDTPVGAYGRSNDTIAAPFLMMRGPHGGPRFASSLWPRHTGCSLEAMDRTVHERPR
jgi:hypothetical protein